MAVTRLTKVSLAAALALAAVLSHAQTPPAPDRTLYVTVTDKQGKYIKGLRREDFVVHDGKQRYAPASLAQADAPASVVLLLDASGSVQDVYAKMRLPQGSARLREAILHFIARSHPENEYFVVAFAREPRLHVVGASGAGEVLAQLERVGLPEKKQAQTAFYDALHFALETSARGRHAKRVVVAFTDGQDNSSKRSFAQVRRAARESDVLFYAVCLRTPHDNVIGFTGWNILEELSVPSGGMVLFAGNGSELLASADLLAVELRSQYALSFAAAPSEKRDGWHELKVRLNDVRDEKGKPVKFGVRARGFYDEAARRVSPPAQR